MTAKRYLGLVAALGIALAAGVVVFCTAVDPYGLRTAGEPIAPGKNEADQQPGEFWRKAFAVRQAMPRTVILGTSRANSALDPNHPALAGEDTPVLNLALGAAHIEQMRLLLIHANTVSGASKPSSGSTWNPSSAADGPIFMLPLWQVTRSRNRLGFRAYWCTRRLQHWLAR